MMEDFNRIISNCPLCEKHALHVIEQDDVGLMQCINCGYVSTNKFIGTKKDNKEYQKLTDDMKEWSVENNNRIWTPTMMTLPMGMLYPFNDDNNDMKWGYAEMINISEEEQKDYPMPNGGFYNKRYDVDNAKVYDTFFEAMFELNEIAKDEQQTPQKLKLPKLKKI